MASHRAGLPRLALCEGGALVFTRGFHLGLVYIDLPSHCSAKFVCVGVGDRSHFGSSMTLGSPVGRGVLGGMATAALRATDGTVAMSAGRTALRRAEQSRSKSRDTH